MKQGREEKRRKRAYQPLQLHTMSADRTENLYLK